MFDLMPFGHRDNWIRSLESMEKDFWNGFGGALGAFRTDVLDQKDQYVVEAELPGFEKKDISIDVKDGYLTVHAAHKEESEQKDEGQYLRRERRYGSFTRSFDLSGIDESKIKAAYENGLLTLNLPKKEAAPQQPTRRIELE